MARFPAGWHIASGPTTIFRDDPELLKRFREGDEQSLRQVYWAYVDLVGRVIRHGVVAAGGQHVKGAHADAADLVQETFVRAFAPRARLAYDGLREYRPYLLRIARNLLIDRARKSGREVLADEEWEGLEKSMATPAEDPFDKEPWEDPEITKVVETYVASLKPPLQEIYEHRYVRSHSQVATAEAMGLTRQKVRTLEERLRKGLKKALKRHERERAHG